jgi:hypothetical protein
MADEARQSFLKLAESLIEANSLAGMTIRGMFFGSILVIPLV